MAEIYLAFYKGNGPSFYDRMVDGAIRLFTKGEYSHVELAVKKEVSRDDGSIATVYECYSSSPRDGGVRVKQINVDNPEQWVLYKLKCTDEDRIKSYYEVTKGKKYDLRGALGVVLGFRQKKNRYFKRKIRTLQAAVMAERYRFNEMLNRLSALFLCMFF